MGYVEEKDVPIVADYWETYNGKLNSKENTDSKDVRCLLCPNCCIIREGKAGKCNVRKNIGGQLIASAYGKLTSIALDPIEKKPIYEFHSGKNILSIGSYGCNFHCPFCQNHTISIEYENIRTDSITPGEAAQLAVRYVPMGNIGLAYTYNEPLINYEFIKNCCIEAKNKGLLNVLVTNGYINIDPLDELLPFIDAMNIDIKGVTEGTYKMVGGTQESVRKVVERSSHSCHIEITTLVLPGENEDSVDSIAKWLASIDKNIPYHLSRFFPKYKYSGREATPAAVMYKLKDIAGRYLNKVYLGNMG